jgi:nucleoside-diphosphate-sugar epimerase
LKKSLLLIGATGFIGRSILTHLKDEYDTITVGRSNADIICDLNESKIEISSIFDLVIIAAGIAHINTENISPPGKLYIENINIIQNIISSFSKEFTPIKVLYLSSVSVYGLSFGELIDETYFCDPHCENGKAKLMSEQLLNSWASDSDLLLTIFRLPLVVGEFPPGNLKAMEIAIKSGYYFNIKDNLAKKSMVLTSDISKFLTIATNIGGTYNLADGYNPTVNEFSNQIALYFNKRKPILLPLFLLKFVALVGDFLPIIFPLNSHRLSKLTQTLTFSDNKARRKFGWEPSCVLTFYQNNRNLLPIDKANEFGNNIPLS